ncbi:MAG: CRISPR-associated helicase Cas3' [Bacteroidales bacterium]|jgi:CRISPR-associated endonuclease/helicase Cas3|nr:CRISPR-associated helicase Cas3' [Bacteroidales bacterium]
MQDFDIQFFEKLIPRVNDYYAHIPKPEQKDRKPELLAEHSAKVVAYAERIVEVHHLDTVIEKLIEDSIPEKLEDKQLLAGSIHKLFWQAIAFHDLGKLNLGFQRNRMHNEAALLKVKHPFQNQHSVISVYLFLALFFADFLNMQLTDEEEIFLCNIALYLSYPIYKHHSATIGQAQDEANWDNADLFTLKPYLSLFGNPLNDEHIELFHSCFLENADFNFLFNHFNESILKRENAFPLYALVKLNYSILTAADYLATAHYMNDWKRMLSDYGILDNVLKAKIIFNARNLKLYNRQVYKALDKGDIPEPDKFKVQKNENLNALRRCIAMEVIGNVRKNTNKNLFYIEAPTGSGKTNISMLALAELLKTDSSLQKVFYVFPFTTLITQTYQSLKDTLGLQEGELAEIHSKAALQKRTSERETNEDSDYKNYLDNLFMNYPITLLSHVRFFDVLKTNEKETNYLLHRLANSVVIIDEIQSYSPKTWDKIIYFIANYAKYFNMKFIIMSATLPKIGDIIDRKELSNDFVYLISDKKKYFQNPNFCNRVKLDYSLLEWGKPDKNGIENYLEQLCETVFNKSVKYAQDNSKYPDSVFTIIEFIFKKTASEFYSIANRNNNLFDEILLLSGTILEPRRKQIIEELKSKETRNKKILLITTQVVEAGVDIDMDLGFKDKSIIDSEEQLAGRINRNVNKPECALYLFDCNEEKTIYKDDERYRIMCELDDEYKTILEQKDFDRLYRLVIEKIKKLNHTHYIVNIRELFDAVATLNFRAVNDSLKIIDQQNVSVFVPLEIDSHLINKNIATLEELHIPYSTVLNGMDVWNKYVAIVQDQDEDFVKDKIQMKKLQSLLSLFTFSVFPKGQDYENLRTYGREELGFLYLENYDKIYSLEDGLNVDGFSYSNFL